MNQKQFRNFHTLTGTEVLKLLNVSKEEGLTEKEAAARIHTYGYNRLEKKRDTPVIVKFFSQFADFMIIILILAAIVSFLVSLYEGKADYVDPIIIFTIIILNAIIGTAQEAKAEKSLEALKKLSSPTAMTLRDGIVKPIPSQELVPGDIVSLEAGSLVPADLYLLTAVHLKADESSLTGESNPVNKAADMVLPEETPLAERKNLALASSMITYGRGTGIVTATGMNTEVGTIARLMQEDKTPPTPLQKRLASLGKTLGIAALLICGVIFVLGILQGRPAFDMFMTSVSLAVASIPEGLPIVVTIMLSLGVQTMAKKNTVVRRLPAVETLGSATVICSDKTGTLTQNKMTVTDLRSIKGQEALTGSFAKYILTLACQCCDSKVQYEKGKKHITGDSTENAIVKAADNISIDKVKLELTNKRIQEIPFDSNRKRMTTLHKTPEGNLQITKGAFDFLLPLCTHIYEEGKVLPLTQSHKKNLKKQNLELTDHALRVIAVAVKHGNSSSPAENGLTFVGMIGMIDPPRPEVYDAVITCKEAGIRPVMITGDHIATASSIAGKLGILRKKEEAITGNELDAMSQEELKNTISQYRVFARVSPEHKVRIVKAFQNQGHVVAMTGDGVNDAPALKAADIGCAMGLSGTDVAKNAADMILTDDNFATIVAAVREGRGIYDNIKKSVHFLLSSNIGEIITIFAAILFKLPAPLLAIHLLWINLVTDSLPAIALGLEKPEKDIMRRPPLSAEKSMFADGLMFKIVFEGMLIGSLALTAFVIGCRYTKMPSLALGQTMCFAVLSLSQLFHSFNMRSAHSLKTIGIFSNFRLLLSFLFCSFLQIIVISYAPLSRLFKVTRLSPVQWGVVLILSICPILVVELQKRRYNTRE